MSLSDLLVLAERYAFTASERAGVERAWVGGLVECYRKEIFAVDRDVRSGRVSVDDFAVLYADAQANKYIAAVVDGFHRQADGGE